MSDINLDIRVCFVQAFQSFRGRDDGHELDVLSAVLLNEINCGYCGAAGGQHRVGDNDSTQFDRGWQLAVVFVRLMGCLVAVESDVTNLCGRNECQNTIYHTETGT